VFCRQPVRILKWNHEIKIIRLFYHLGSAILPRSKKDDRLTTLAWLDGTVHFFLAMTYGYLND
jgi:hypothetical protein